MEKIPVPINTSGAADKIKKKSLTNRFLARVNKNAKIYDHRGYIARLISMTEKIKVSKISRSRLAAE